MVGGTGLWFRYHEPTEGEDMGDLTGELSRVTRMIHESLEEDEPQPLTVSAEDQRAILDLLYDAWTFDVVSITEVVDGDTVRARVDLGFGRDPKLEIRLNGIDTPEKRGREKRAGLAVKSLTSEMLYQWERDGILLESRGVVKSGKYGRCLGDLVNKRTGQSYVSIMLENGLAKPYQGKTKQPFTEQEIDVIVDKAQSMVDKLVEEVEFDW
jgi:micrococcal nuclease